MCGESDYPAAEGKEYELTLVNVNDTIANKWIRFKMDGGVHAYLKIECTSSSGDDEMLIGAFHGGADAGCADLNVSHTGLAPEEFQYIVGDGYLDLFIPVGQYTVVLSSSTENPTEKTYTFNITSESKALGFFQTGQTENAWAYFVTEK